MFVQKFYKEEKTFTDRKVKSISNNVKDFCLKLERYFKNRKMSILEFSLRVPSLKRSIKNNSTDVQDC
mgnify:CR=1 FL=1